MLIPRTKPEDLYLNLKEQFPSLWPWLKTIEPKSLKVESMSFGVSPGRSVSVESWQGVAEPVSTVDTVTVRVANTAPTIVEELPDV